jgi:2-dehydro-3-deoxygluconokinase
MKIITFGEIMLRLTPSNGLRFSQATSYESSYGGGEANVAVSLAHFGHETYFVSKVPNNAVGEGAIRSLRAEGVNTTYIAIGGERLGIYFLEKGASQRPSQVIYDRKSSSISTCQKEDFDFDRIFEDVSWFHFTGITPALSESVSEILMEAVQKAKSRGIKISCDLNYRKKLWSKAKAQEVMSRYMPYVDVLIANEEDAENIFGIKAENSEVQTGLIDSTAYQSVASQLSSRFNIPMIAITLRTSVSADDNLWSGMVYNKGVVTFASSYKLHIVDRVGGGDSFAAGLIHAQLMKYDDLQSVQFATAASALKHSIVGDFNRVSLSEVETLMNGDGSGRVQR